ncbi:MAG: hypothetical protein BWX49_00561 [Bacteroidetes bacterium ADurb.Bin008]|nr:MAG: hypothetical protein BWX49_00561 [Bacteroidetes bacterium ADurb.Bin008]
MKPDIRNNKAATNKGWPQARVQWKIEVLCF